ncbi:hypothetical protein D3C72_1601010 [compost metagenome]
MVVVKSPTHVPNSINEVEEGIIGRVVRAKISMNIAIGEPLGAHIIDMIRGLEHAPIANELKVVRTHNVIFKCIEVTQGFFLHIITKPSG